MGQHIVTRGAIVLTYVNDLKPRVSELQGIEQMHARGLHICPGGIIEYDVVGYEQVDATISSDVSGTLVVGCVEHPIVVGAKVLDRFEASLVVIINIQNIREPRRLKLSPILYF